MICFQKIYGFHALNHQIIMNKWYVTPVTDIHIEGRKVESRTVFCLSRICKKTTLVKMLKIFTIFKISRPLSAGGSGLELVGIKEPELPPVSFDVCCHFYVEFVLMSFFGHSQRNSQIILKLPWGPIFSTWVRRQKRPARNMKSKWASLFFFLNVIPSRGVPNFLWISHVL